MTDRRIVLALCLGIALTPLVAAGQAGRGTAAPTAAGMRSEAAKLTCPQVLGLGTQTGRTFCDVVITRDPAEGVIIPLPPHTGAVTLTFDLHNRHTYSEELSKTTRGYRRYTAMVGALAMDNTPLGRAVVLSEFRTVKDLFDRVLGGTGPGGVKAVAPTGVEPVTIIIPADEPTEAVSIVGLRVTEGRIDGDDTFSAAGRPVAVVSSVMVHYRPGPSRAPAKRR